MFCWFFKELYLSFEGLIGSEQMLHISGNSVSVALEAKTPWTFSLSLLDTEIVPECAY